MRRPSEISTTPAELLLFGLAFAAAVLLVTAAGRPANATPFPPVDSNHDCRVQSAESCH
jgi:hypothetical protein